MFIIRKFHFQTNYFLIILNRVRNRVRNELVPKKIPFLRTKVAVYPEINVRERRLWYNIL